MPATIQQDITLCINATGCPFTGPLVLRHSLSTVLPILYLWNYTVVDTLVLFTDTLYIIFSISYYYLLLIFPAPLFICYCLLRSQ